MDNKKPFVITIGRERGSGGRIVGKELARRLDIAYYDREILAVASKELEVDEEFLSGLDEHSLSLIRNVFPYNSVSFNYLPTEAELIGVQTRLINEFSEGHSCVIVGRCADYVLRDNPNCVNVFLHSNMEERIAHIADIYGVTQEDARKKIKKMDAERSKYYHSVTGQDWSNARNYHLCLNTSLLGIDKSCELIEKFVKSFLER